MELTDVTRVETLTSSAEVNKYLDLGWKLINTYTTAYDTIGPGCNHLTIHFVIAWVGPDPQFPSDERTWHFPTL